MRIAVIGAGPAGLTSAKQAIDAGHAVTVFERHESVGGIWNPDSGGAYPSVRMQSSAMSFPFSTFAPGNVSDFPTLAQVHAYLLAYAADAGVDGLIRFGQSVDKIVKRDGSWHVQGTATQGFDAVMIATGELWEPIRPSFVPSGSSCAILTAKDYDGPERFAGQRVLVVGGGVSGADIAAELTGHAERVDWSIRRKAIFLPRDWDDVPNDDLFSYAARVAVGEMPYADYLDLLGRIMPSYMAMYASSGLLPPNGFNNAAHVNERIVPLVHAGAVTVVPAFKHFTPDGGVVLADAVERRYDAVILCMGYEAADYSFVDGLRHDRLFRHFIYADDPTIAVINTPIGTEAYGTACPYFEAIAGWVLQVFTGRLALPPAAEMDRWCRDHLDGTRQRRFYDCWLETIRLRLEAGTIPDPLTRFDEYWSLVASRVEPQRLSRPLAPMPAAFDHLIDMADLKARVLASLPEATRDLALAQGRIGPAEHARAYMIDPGRVITPDLPYRYG